MYGYKNIYESYYEHPCSITADEDVIYKDIRGKGVLLKLKRWWFDLLLPSYSDRRSKHYYMTSHAMMRARTALFRNSRGYIHPFSKFRNFWDGLILHLLILHTILFHFTTSIIHYTPLFLRYLVAGIEYVFILDIFISTRTGYAVRKSRDVIMTPSGIFFHNLSTNAFIHVLCAIPLQNLIILRLGNVTDTANNANYFVSTMMMMNTFHLIRLIQVSGWLAKDRGTFWKTMAFRLIRIIVVGLVSVVQIETLTLASDLLHIICCEQRIYYPGTSYLESMMFKKYGEQDKKPEYLFVYVMISRLVKSFFLFGYCLRPNTDIIDQLNSILTYSTAFIFHFWASVVVYNCIVRNNALDHTLWITRDQTYSILRQMRLSDEIHIKVKKYYECKLSHALVIERRNRLFRALPGELKLEIKMSNYRGLVEKIPCFAKWPEEMVADVVELLYSEIYLEDDVLSSADGQPVGLVLVEAGMLAVYSGGREVGHLVDGDHHGEHTIATTDEVPSADLVAITPTGIQVVDKACFLEMMKRYPPEYLSEMEQSVSREY